MCIKAYLNLRGKLILRDNMLVVLLIILIICLLQYYMCCIIWTSVSAAMNLLASIVFIL
jgi:hypothetical protein